MRFKLINFTIQSFVVINIQNKLKAASIQLYNKNPSGVAAAGLVSVRKIGYLQTLIHSSTIHFWQVT